MVKQVLIKEDCKTKDGQELKKGVVVKAYKPLQDELIGSKKAEFTKEQVKKDLASKKEIEAKPIETKKEEIK